MIDPQPPHSSPESTLGGEGMSEAYLRRLPSTPHLCLHATGLYWKLSGTFARLRSWMDAHGVVAAGPALGVFYDDPEVTPPEQCRYSICYPLGPGDATRAQATLDAEATDTPAVEPYPEMTVAAIEYAGPASASPAVYAALARWVEDHGLTPTGPPREVYLAEPGTAGKGMMHAEVQQPVLSP